MPQELVSAIRNGLMDWREDVLLDRIYPGTITISPGTVLGDDVIDQLTKERVETGIQLRQQTRWFLGFQDSTAELTEHGEALLHKLKDIYNDYDAEIQAEQERIANLPPPNAELTPAIFYGPSSLRRSTRRTARAGTGTVVESSGDERVADSARGGGGARGKGRGRGGRQGRGS